MRSATSYFNGPLYRKTLARFWPLWGLWGAIWLFALPLNLLTTHLNQYPQSYSYRYGALLNVACHLPQWLMPGLVLAFAFGVLCAMAVFGYLYNHRSACWTHALPLRREALFTTQYLAGLSMLLLPQLAACLLAGMVELSFLPAGEWGNALPPLLTLALAQSGISLFFFSFASFCAMFTGHILALPAFYLILNCLAYGLWFLFDALLNEFYYGYAGISGMSTVVTYLTPFAALREAAGWWPAYGETPAHLLSPGTIAVYAAVGAGLALFSLYVYRRRHVETAGDVVAVAVVRPLFKYGVSFCSGLAFGMFTAAFFGWTELPVLVPCILFWTFIGYFAAEMLLRKSFKVFKAWKGGAVMTAVMLALCLACFLDLFGVVERVPAPKQVEYVMVDIDMGYPYDSGHILNAHLSSPAQIELITALHRAIVDNRDDQEYRGHDSGSDYVSADFVYYLSNGQELRRRYRSVPIYTDDLDDPGSVASAMKHLAENRELVAMAYGFEDFLTDARLTSAWLDGLHNRNGDYSQIYLDDYRQELWDAVQADFAEGTIGVRYFFNNGLDLREDTYGVDLVFEASLDSSQAKSPAGGEDGYSVTYDSMPSKSMCITLTPQARHTLAVLDKTGIWENGWSLGPETDYIPGGSEIVY